MSCIWLAHLHNTFRSGKAPNKVGSSEGWMGVWVLLGVWARVSPWQVLGLAKHTLPHMARGMQYLLMLN